MLRDGGQGHEAFVIARVKPVSVGTSLVVVFGGKKVRQRGLKSADAIADDGGVAWGFSPDVW